MNLNFFERTKDVNKRLLYRSFFYMLLTACGLWALEIMVNMTIHRQLDVMEKYPEVMNMLRAATMMTFMEMCILWMRLIQQPKLDVQRAATVSEQHPIAAAITYLTYTLAWAFRVVVFLVLSGLIGNVV